MSERVRERAHNYLVDAQWTMPALSSLGVGDATVSTAASAASHMYFDTPDHALWDHGITLRRHASELGNAWELTLPNGAAPAEIALQSAAPGRGVPAELRGLLAGVRAGRRLSPVVKINTDRRLVRIVDNDGTMLAEIADERVRATQLGSVAVVTTWREVAVQPGDGDRQLLGHISQDLSAAGAKPVPEGVSRLARALGSSDDAVESRPELRTVADATREYLNTQYRAVVAGDVALRQGQEPIHATRVAIRRYRSVLQVLADVFDSDRATALETELAWYAGVLGEVRDRQVLRAHFDDELHALAPELLLGPVAATIDQHLLAEQLKAAARLGKVLRGKRYAALMMELRAWYEQPPFTAAAERRAVKIEKYLRKAQHKLGSRLSAARDNSSDNEGIHRARKAGKRARYIAELAEPVLGKAARRYAKRATAMQDALGAHQDSVVARDVLRRLGTRTARVGGENGFTFGLLYGLELSRAEQSRRHADAQIKRL